MQDVNSRKLNDIFQIFMTGILLKCSSLDVVFVSVLVSDLEWSNWAMWIRSDGLSLSDSLEWFKEGGSGVADWVSWDTFVLWVGWVSSVWVTLSGDGLGLVVELDGVGSGGESEEGEEFHFLN